MTYISWFIDIGLYLEDSVMYKAVTLAGGIREPLLTCSSFSSFFIFLSDLVSLSKFTYYRALNVS